MSFSLVNKASYYTLLPTRARQISVPISKTLSLLDFFHASDRAAQACEQLTVIGVPFLATYN